MKKYSLPAGRAQDYPHPAPERTAQKAARGIFDEDIYQVWSNRAAMAKSVRMQERRAPRFDDWRPLVPLEIPEGY